MSKTETGIQFAKFSCVGFLNTAIHYGLFYLLYKMLGIYYLASSVLGYCCGITTSYALNKTWTFRSDDDRIGLQMSKFVTVNVASLLVNVGTMSYLVGNSGMLPEYSQIVAIAFSVVVNFLGNKFWTFEPRTMTGGAPPPRTASLPHEE